MRIFVQLVIIFTVSLIGIAVSSAIHIGIPASIVSMILLLFLLIFKIVKIRHIQNVSDFLINHLAFFFIPSGVSLVKSFSLISDKLLKLIIICTVNTIITFLVTIYTVILVTKIIGKDNSNE